MKAKNDRSARIRRAQQVPGARHPATLWVTPVAELAATEKDLDELALLFKLLQMRDPDVSRRFLRLEAKPRKIKRDTDGGDMPSSWEEWTRRATTLAAEAAHDDDALIKLVEHDPRFLCSQLVVARVMRWRAQVVLTRYVRGSDEHAAMLPAAAKYAKRMLKKLAAAIAATGRSGSSAHVSVSDFEQAEDEVERKVEMAIAVVGAQKKRRPLTPAALAKAVALPAYEAELAGLIAGTQTKASVVEMILCRWFGLGKRALADHRAHAHASRSEAYP